ncbi:MAG: hypothetical protein AAF738_07800, partial [Bacteroidota bacterium]
IVNGVRPLYASLDEWRIVTNLPPQPIEELGKIYYKSPYLFVHERFKGLHIIDNSDPENPAAIGFIQIFGSEDIAINGTIMYADNYTDFVVIDISDIQNVREVNRLENFYSDKKNTFPNGYSGHFECVNSDLGVVVGWEEAELLEPKCLR